MVALASYCNIYTITLNLHSSVFLHLCSYFGKNVPNLEDSCRGSVINGLQRKLIPDSRASSVPPPRHFFGGHSFKLQALISQQPLTQFA